MFYKMKKFKLSKPNLGLNKKIKMIFSILYCFEINFLIRYYLRWLKNKVYW